MRFRKRSLLALGMILLLVMNIASAARTVIVSEGSPKGNKAKATSQIQFVKTSWPEPPKGQNVPISDTHIAYINANVEVYTFQEKAGKCKTANLVSLYPAEFARLLHESERVLYIQMDAIQDEYGNVHPLKGPNIDGMTFTEAKEVLEATDHLKFRYAEAVQEP